MIRARRGIFGGERVFSRSFWVIFIGRLVVRASFNYGEYRTGNCTQRTWMGSLQAMTSADKIIYEKVHAVSKSHTKNSHYQTLKPTGVIRKDITLGVAITRHSGYFHSQPVAQGIMVALERELFGTKVMLRRPKRGSGSLAPFFGSSRLRFHGGKIVKFREPSPVVASHHCCVWLFSESVHFDDLRSSLILISLLAQAVIICYLDYWHKHCNWCSRFQPLSSISDILSAIRMAFEKCSGYPAPSILQHT